MKKLFVLLSIMMFGIINLQAQHLKKDGTPDMRFKENKETYGTANSYSTTANDYTTPSADYSTTSETNTDVRYQNSYIKSDGTYVDPHYKTNNNNTNSDNFSSKDNLNTYTGTTGERAKDYTSGVNNYGNGKTIYTGPKGGQYYYNSIGKKVYVPKR